MTKKQANAEREIRDLILLLQRQSDELSESLKLAAVYNMQLRAQIAALQAWKDAVPVQAIRSIFDDGGIVSCSASDGLIPPAGTVFRVHWKNGKDICSLADAMGTFVAWVQKLEVQRDRSPQD